MFAAGKKNCTGQSEQYERFHMANEAVEKPLRERKGVFSEGTPTTLEHTIVDCSAI
jgi:hypothetical protein